MTLRPNAIGSIMLIFAVLISMACQQQAANTSANANAKATPANTVVAVKPTETETQQADPSPVGKEVKPSDGPALKSITPPDGAILAGGMGGMGMGM